MDYNWVLVVMDRFTRRLVGFGVHCGAVAGAEVCRMFNAAIDGFVERLIGTMRREFLDYVLF